MSSKLDFKEELTHLYNENKALIKDQIKSFENNFKNSNDEKIFCELCFCILSSGVGPKVAEESMMKIENSLWDGTSKEIINLLQGIHKYPEKASYLIETRDYLKKEFDFEIKSLIKSFENKAKRRDFFANNKNIKGLGYMQASHFLRNLGFKDYAILDRNNIKSLYEFGLLEKIKQPSTRKQYLETEKIMKDFAKDINIDINELDLLLWFRTRGYIPK